MRYYISDLHFYHESLLTKMDCRGFENCDKMHEYMIERWNKKVRVNNKRTPSAYSHIQKSAC